MAAFIINCPLCGQVLEVEEEWSGVETHCVRCRGAFIIPRRGMSATSPGDVADAERENTAGKAKSVFLLVMFLGILGLVTWAVIKFMTPTPESLKGNQLYVTTTKRINRDRARGMMDIAKDFFTTTDLEENFYYRKSIFQNFFLREDSHEMYSGTIQFVRNNKTMTRPVAVDARGKAITSYRFPFKYAEHPEYLEEDGDLIFALAGSMDRKLREWAYVSGKVEGGTLVCTVRKDGVTKTVKLKAEQVICKDNIGRIWVEILP